MPPKSKLEKEVKADIKVLLKELGAWAYMPVPGGYGAKGIPDHIACVPLEITPDMIGETMGIFVGIEAKRLGKEASAHQVAQINLIRDAKGLAFTVDGAKDEPGNFKVVESALHAIFLQSQSEA